MDRDSSGAKKKGRKFSGHKKRKKPDRERERELARRKQVAKITPERSLSVNHFLQEYDANYRGDSSTSEENSDEGDAHKDEDSSGDDNSSEDDDDANDHNQNGPESKQSSSETKEKRNEKGEGDSEEDDDDDDESKRGDPSDILNSKEEKEVDELVRLAKELQGTETIDERYEKLKARRAARTEKRRLDEINKDEPWHARLCRILTCQPRPGTVPSMKVQRRWMEHVKNESIAAVLYLSMFGTSQFFVLLSKSTWWLADIHVNEFALWLVR